MKVTLKLLVDYQKYLPPGTKDGLVVFDVPPGTQAKNLLKLLAIPFEESIIFLINGLSASASDELHEGDTVFIFSAATGG